MHLMHTYKRLPVVFERGQGDRLWDIDNNEYIDAISGIGVTSLGHAHPVIAESIAKQAAILMHTSNMAEIYWQSLLGEKLCDLSDLDKAFICNSGCEANEVALKIARLCARKKGVTDPRVVVMENAFHGRTFATNAASLNLTSRTGFEFEPQICGFVRVPFDDLDSVRKAAEQHPNIVAIMVEPIQGEGGVRVFSPGYLKGLRQICDEQNWLLMLDEIQCGIGRTGHWFAYQHEHIIPDVLTVAKALGNGFPIGACLAKGEAANILSPGSYGSTFGGNPLASRVACTVLDLIKTGAFVSKAGILGTIALRRLQQALSNKSGVIEVRGLGLMMGVELAVPARHLMEQAMKEERVLLNVTRDKVIRLLPSFVSSEETLNLVIDKVCRQIASLDPVHISETKNEIWTTHGFVDT